MIARQLSYLVFRAWPLFQKSKSFFVRHRFTKFEMCASSYRLGFADCFQFWPSLIPRTHFTGKHMPFLAMHLR
ncbi:hypothetical protein M758_9G072800 [Ceratodon purpureus]|nr:hypothetical protein M758_9G072800 [Ceratodon purpureus]